MTTQVKSIKEELKQMRSESKELIDSARNFIDVDGIVFDLKQWVTIKKYCELFNINDTQLVSNWIIRGVIPKENVQIIEELNGLKLIKAIPYSTQSRVNV